jgi:hypothetical protein
MADNPNVVLRIDDQEIAVDRISYTASNVEVDELLADFGELSKGSAECAITMPHDAFVSILEWYEPGWMPCVDVDERGTVVVASSGGGACFLRSPICS